MFGWRRGVKNMKDKRNHGAGASHAHASSKSTKRDNVTDKREPGTWASPWPGTGAPRTHTSDEPSKRVDTREDTSTSGEENSTFANSKVDSDNENQNKDCNDETAQGEFVDDPAYYTSTSGEENPTFANSTVDSDNENQNEECNDETAQGEFADDPAYYTRTSGEENPTFTRSNVDSGKENENEECDDETTQGEDTDHPAFHTNTSSEENPSDEDETKRAPTTKRLTRSKSDRQEGNEQLRSSREKGISQFMRKQKLQASIRSYNSALSHARSIHDHVFALKNLAIAHRDLCLVHLRDLEDLAPLNKTAAKETGQKTPDKPSPLKQVQDGRNQVQYTAGAMIKYSAQAIVRSRAAMPQGKTKRQEWLDWQVNVAATAAVFVHNMFHSLKKNSTSAMDFVGSIHPIAHHSDLGELPEVQFVLCYELTRFHYNEASAERFVTATISESATHAAHTYRPMEESRVACQRLLLNKDTMKLLRKSEDFFPEDDEVHPSLQLCADAESEIAVLEAEINHLNARMQSFHCIREGDHLISRGTNGIETIEPELVWMAVDSFQQAVLLVRDVDLETEATGCSRIGRCYTHYLAHSKARGKNYAKQALELALSLHPHVVLDNEKWFMEAKKIVEAFQDRVRVNDENKKAEEAAPHLAALKGTLHNIELLADKEEADELLRYIYENHPPKNTSHKRVTTKQDDAGKESTVSFYHQLRNCLIHYHPDKNKNHGKEWEVLCSEISKYVNAVYQYYKDL